MKTKSFLNRLQVMLQKLAVAIIAPFRPNNKTASTITGKANSDAGAMPKASCERFSTGGPIILCSGFVAPDQTKNRIPKDWSSGKQVIIITGFKASAQRNATHQRDPVDFARMAAAAVLLSFSFTSTNASAFSIGNRIAANTTANVRSSAAGTSVGQHFSGDLGTIASAGTNAVYAGVSYVWYKVNWDTTPTTGWSIQDALSSVPAITGVSPPTVTGSNSGQPFNANGSGFINGAQLKFSWPAVGVTPAGSATLAATFISSSQLQASPTFGTDPGTWTVQVINPGGVTSTAYSFNVLAPVPAITSLSTASATAGGPAFNLIAYGSTFDQNSVIRWNGVALPTTPNVTSGGLVTYLTAQVPASDLASAGTATITVYTPSPGGGTSGGSTFTISSQKASPVSISLSSIFALPNTVQADGISTIKITVQILDSRGMPVAGESVTISGGTAPVQITQPASLTDINGQAIAFIKSTTPTTCSVFAIDHSASVLLNQEASITFTSAFIQPPMALVDAINRLSADATKTLGTTIPQIASHEGEIGDFFEKETGTAAAQQIIDTTFFFLGGSLDEEVSKLSLFNQAIVAYGLQIEATLDDARVQQNVDTIVENTTGLTQLGHGYAITSASFGANIGDRATLLLAGVPLASVNTSAALSNDLTLRLEANQVLSQVLQYQDNRLADAQMIYQVGTHSWYDSFWFQTGVTALTLVTPPPAGLIIGAVDYEAGTAFKTEDFLASAKSYKLAFDSQLWDVNLGGMIYSNTVSGFNAIANGQPPNPVSGKILSSLTVLSGNQQNVNPVWVGADPVTTPSVAWESVTTGNSQVVITNTGLSAAAFEVYAFYYYGINVVGTQLNLPMVVSTVTNLSAGQTAQVQLTYANANNGAFPSAGSTVLLYLLCQRGQDMFYGDFASNTTEWQLPLLSASGSAIKMNTSPAAATGSASTVITDNPIKTTVLQNVTNQSYTARIEIKNPFSIPLIATVTQTIPANVTVLSTDGSRLATTMVWSNTVPTNGLLVCTFGFFLPATPGNLTNLPAPSLVFSDVTGTNTLTVPASAPAFNTLVPVQVNLTVPVGIAGTPAKLSAVLTNWNTINQFGSLTLLLTDATGSVLTNLSQPFSVMGSGHTSLGFTLPAISTSGNFKIQFTLNVNGGSSLVFSSVYAIPPTPLALKFGAPIWAGGGLQLIASGPAGSNALIVWSTNLLDWSPRQYVSLTNGLIHIVDPIATNYAQGFYRIFVP